MTECIRKSEDVSTYAAGGNINLKLRGVAMKSASISIGGSYTAANAIGTPLDFAPWSLFGRVTMDQGGPPLIAGVEAKLLVVLDALLNGAVPQRIAQTVANGVLAGELTVNFAKMFPGAGCDATVNDLNIRGQWQGLTSYSETDADGPTAYAITALATCVTDEFVPQGGYIKPQLTQVDLDIATAGQAVERIIKFESGCTVPYLLLSAEDATGFTTLGDTYKAKDGIIRSVAVTLNEPNKHPQVIMPSIPWNVLREHTRRRSGLTGVDDALLAGRVLIPMLEKNEKTGRMEPINIDAGSTISFVLDTQSTVAAQYTSVTVAAGDLLKVLVPKFSRIGIAPAAGSPTVGVVASNAAVGQGQARQIQRGRRAA